MAKTRAYSLNGTGECYHFGEETYSKKTFHAEARPNLPPPGDYIQDVFKYNGEMPENFIYKDRAYVFYNSKK